MASNINRLNSGVTHNEKHDLNLKFTIYNFLEYLCKPGKALESPQSDCVQHCGAKWILQVYPHGKTENQKDHIAVFLKQAHKPPHAEVDTAQYEFYVAGKHGKKLNVAGPFKMAKASKRGHGSSTFITRIELEARKNLYLPNGHLTICCDGEAFHKKPDRQITFEIPPQGPQAAPDPSLSILKKMYDDSICSDVILKTGTAGFRCHKAVLATTSNYFMNLFEHNVKFNSNNVVDFSKDLNEHELKAMLDYIYLGERKFAHLSRGSFQKLFIVAGKYEIDGLPELCETEIIRQLNKDNAKELIIFAMSLCAKRLEKAAATVIARG